MTAALAALRPTLAITFTSLAVVIELTAGALAAEYGNWIQRPDGVNASQSAGWWMAGLLVGHTAIVAATVRPERSPTMGRVTAAAKVVGIVTSLIWGVLLLFLSALGSSADRSWSDVALNLGMPFLHIGVFIFTVAIASAPSRPMRTASLSAVVAVSVLAAAAAVTAPLFA